MSRRRRRSSLSTRSIERDDRVGSRVLVLPLAVALSLSACAPVSGPGVRQDWFELPVNGGDIPPCPISEPILATDLASLVNDCDRDGATLVFPDGQEVVIPSYASSYSTVVIGGSASSGGTYSVMNHGTSGVIAALRTPEDQSTWWGPRDSLVAWWESQGREAPD